MCTAYPEDYWTLERIGHVIGVVWSALCAQWRLAVVDPLGLEQPAPQRLAIQRDEEQIVQWKRRVLPRIKKSVVNCMPGWFWKMKVAFAWCPPLKNSWAPRGHTPGLRTSLDHHQRLNLMGALLISSGGRHFKLSVHSYRHNLRGEQVILFLRNLLRILPVRSCWFGDNHPMHKRRLVQRFIESHPRLHVYHFPICAPELNPAEFVWAQISPDR